MIIKNPIEDMAYTTNSDNPKEGRRGGKKGNEQKKKKR